MKHDYIKLAPYQLKDSDLESVMPSALAAGYFNKQPISCDMDKKGAFLLASNYETESYLPMGVIVAKYDKCAVHFLQGTIADSTARAIESGIMLADEAVDRHVLYINSGGGEEEAMYRILDAISKAQKPVFAYVTGGAYSAAQIIALHCRHIYAENRRTGFGSIGVMAIYEGFKSEVETEDYVYRRLYASKSVNKNAEYEAVMRGETKGIQERLDRSFDAIEATITAMRPELANSEYFDGRECTAMDCEADLFDSYADLMTVLFPDAKKEDKIKDNYGTSAAAENAALNVKCKKMELVELIKAAKYAEAAPAATSAFLLSGATEITAEYLQAVNAEVLASAAKKADNASQLATKEAILQAVIPAATSKAANAPETQLNALDKIMAAKFGEKFVAEMHEAYK